KTLTTSSLKFKFIVGATALGLFLAGCSAEDPDSSPEGEDTQTQGQEIPPVEQNDKLRDQLPKEILDAGELRSVNSGSFPPYMIVESGEHANTGASADLEKALEQLWGVKIKENTVDGLPSELTGIAAGRYDMAFGPV